jgi:hypothetical protein
MSETPDLNQIKEEAAPQAVPADEQTKEEEKDEQQRALSAGQRADRFHAALLAALNGQISGLSAEKSNLQSQVTDCQKTVFSAQRRTTNLADKCGRLEVADHFISWLNLIGTLIVAVGGILISVAGAWPGMFDVVKVGLTLAGTGMAFVGVILAGVTFFLSRSRPVRRGTRPTDVQENPAA